MSNLKTLILPLVLLLSSSVFSMNFNSSLQFKPMPLTQIQEGIVTERSPASLSTPSDDSLMPPTEEGQFLKRRIYYLDPQSGATCLGVEGSNECLEP